MVRHHISQTVCRTCTDVHHSHRPQLGTPTTPNQSSNQRSRFFTQICCKRSICPTVAHQQTLPSAARAIPCDTYLISKKSARATTSRCSISRPSLTHPSPSVPRQSRVLRASTLRPAPLSLPASLSLPLPLPSPAAPQLICGLAVVHPLILTASPRRFCIP